MKRISLCTTCKNRINHIKETLPYNLEVNKRSDTEFVLLDYWSTDGLEEWVKDNLMDYIKSGKLNYYRLKNPIDIFILTHAINVAFKLAQGEIVCNVDADNFTGEDFDEYLLSLFKDSSKIIAHSNSGYGLSGRNAFWKNEFINILGGFDEDLRYGWGFDDEDIRNRGKELGFSIISLDSKKEGSYIHHGNDYRLPFGYYQKAIDNQNLNILKACSLHEEISNLKIKYKIYKANPYRKWGEADVMLNFT